VRKRNSAAAQVEEEDHDDDDEDSDKLKMSQTSSSLATMLNRGPMMKIDSNGRLVQAGSKKNVLSDQKESTKAEQEKMNQYIERLDKWTDMIKNWSKHMNSKDGSVSDKLKSRARKGIPDAVRGAVYAKLLNAESFRKDKEKLYQELIDKPEGSGPLDDVIRRDINRTNPEHVMFMQKDGAGQEALYKVLRAYSFYDPEVGYCQGMGYFVAVMLTYATEEDAFWMLVGLLNGRYNLRELYLPDLRGMRRGFYQFEKLLAKAMPQLSAHLNKFDFNSPIYSARWFGTLCSDLPIECTLRVWDVLLVEGPKILFRIGLTVMKTAKRELKKGTFEDFLPCLREVQRTLDPDEMMKTALSFPIKSKDLQSWAVQFNTKENII